MPKLNDRVKYTAKSREGDLKYNYKILFRCSNQNSIKQKSRSATEKNCDSCVSKFASIRSLQK